LGNIGAASQGGEVDNEDEKPTDSKDDQEDEKDDKDEKEVDAKTKAIVKNIEMMIQKQVGQVVVEFKGGVDTDE
jgi:hypothetical protein